MLRAIANVAERLGNTTSICRKCYVHPVILNSYLEGSLLQNLQQQAAQEVSESLRELRPEEAVVMTLLHARLGEEQRK